MDLLQILKALSDETRLRMLNVLQQGELCVCELETILEINQSNASRHLNRLTQAKIVEFDKQAQYVYYKINKKTLKEYPFIEEIIGHKDIQKGRYTMDIERLHKYRKSGLSCDDLKEKKSCFM